jgi:hypothetical protein
MEVSENSIPELHKNQFGIAVKVVYDSFPTKLVEEVLYFTVNNNSISLELYPKKPIIIIDKDIAVTLLKKIAQFDKPKKPIKTQEVTDLKRTLR